MAYQPFGLYEHGVTAGSTATISFGNADPSSIIQFGWSIAGIGPTPTQFGPVGMAGPINLLPPILANAQGNASIFAPVSSALAGLTIYSQALGVAGGNLVLTNARRVLIQ